MIVISCCQHCWSEGFLYNMIDVWWEKCYTQQDVLVKYTFYTCSETKDLTNMTTVFLTNLKHKMFCKPETSGSRSKGFDRTNSLHMWGQNCSIWPQGRGWGLVILCKHEMCSITFMAIEDSSFGHHEYWSFIKTLKLELFNPLETWFPFLTISHEIFENE